MEEFVCVTVTSASGESQTDFSARLSRFWTHLLRTRPDDFERVYAETIRFESANGRWSRQYLVAVDAVDWLEGEMKSAGVTHASIDRDDLYSKYEATPSDWMQIEH